MFGLKEVGRMYFTPPPPPPKRRIAMPPASLPYTSRADRVLRLAEEEADHFSHEYVGTEHLLLALIREGTGVAARLLAARGIGAGEVRQRVERIVQHGPADDRVVFGDLPLTPRAKSALALAAEEARDLGDREVGPEHLLLGLAREDEGVAAEVLQDLGADLRTVRAEVARRRPAPGEWLTEAVVRLARGIAADGAYDRLPVLADALEDAGCADLEVLGHVRLGAAHDCHAGGCWVLDRLLGDEIDDSGGRPGEGPSVGSPPPRARPWWRFW
jgi:hypothetical protein